MNFEMGSIIISRKIFIESPFVYFLSLNPLFNSVQRSRGGQGKAKGDLLLKMKMADVAALYDVVFAFKTNFAELFRFEFATNV